MAIPDRLIELYTNSEYAHTKAFGAGTVGMGVLALASEFLSISDTLTSATSGYAGGLAICSVVSGIYEYSAGR